MIPTASTVDAQQVDAPQAESEGRSRRSWSFHDEYVLGTRLDVLVNSPSAVLARIAADTVRKEIARLDRVFNHRRADSEISELNRSRRMNASTDLFAVTHLSETWRRITRGAFDGRIGALLHLWSADAAPDVGVIERALAALREASITLDHSYRWIELSPAVMLSFDAIAKGYIVDAALNAARRAALAIEGLAVSIGGDIRCWGDSPDRCGWQIGIPDPTIPADNAPLVDAVSLQNAAIATSGRGPRDFFNNHHRSTTLSPLTGRPVREVMSASVVATHAADADAIATACMVLRVEDSMELVNRLDGVAARITDANGRVHQSSTWQAIRLAASTAQQQGASTGGRASSLPAEMRWPNDWELGLIYKAPDRQDERSADFRTPYMVLWITDMQNRPVRTIFMVGTDAEWQRDNFIWWGSHRERAKQLVELRSQATALSGRYPMYWPGVDDDWQPVPVGKYILHLETSQERGKHSYRSMPIEIGHERFKTELPSLSESGGLEITYGHYNDRFK